MYKRYVPRKLTSQLRAATREKRLGIELTDVKVAIMANSDYSKEVRLCESRDLIRNYRHVPRDVKMAPDIL